MHLCALILRSELRMLRYLNYLKLIETMCQNVEPLKGNSFQQHLVFVPKIVLNAVQEDCFCINKLNKNFTISVELLIEKISIWYKL